MKAPGFVSLTMIVSIMVITSCATTTLKSAWKDKTYSGGPLKKVLVIAVDKNPVVRDLLEDEFARKFQERGVTAVRSHIAFPEDDVLKKEIILAKMKELGIDSVLVTSVADVKTAGRYETYPPYSSLGSFYTFYLACCQYVSTGRDVFIETRIFDARYDKLIWSALSETIVEGPSLTYTIESFVFTVIKDLHIKKLLQ